MENLWTIILAAGEGTRIGLKNINKVSLEISGKPLILQTIQNLKSTGINNIVVVVGHAKESVLSLLDPSIKTVEQSQRLGTADAVRTGLEIVPNSTEYILVLYGDDSYNLDPEELRNLYKTHIDQNNKLTFLTTILENPTGIGRIIRDKNNNLVDLVEEKDASSEQKKIKEVNIACYLFNYQFLKKYLPKINKSLVTGELYLTKIIEIGLKNKQKIKAIKIIHPNWQGINTLDDLEKAHDLTKDDQI